MATGKEVSTGLTADFWRMSNGYAILLSLTRRSLSRHGFRRLLAVQRGAAERMVRNGLPPPCSRAWLQQAAVLLRQAYSELEAGTFPREALHRLDHHFAHLAAGIAPASAQEVQPAGAAGSVLNRRSRR